MFYRVIGIMSGSSLDGLDIAFVEFEETARKWGYEIKAASCHPYPAEWFHKLQNATQLSAYDYLLLHTLYGKYIGEQVNAFIDQFDLHHKVQLIASHGHTTFHSPANGMTAQLGDGAAIAATTQINVVSDLRAMDVAFGGQGAPIVPIGEKLLLADYAYCLNLGGIANLSYKSPDGYIAFDICAANRILNMLAKTEGKEFDEGGAMAASGKVYTPLLTRLNALNYYSLPYPKSLANAFGTDEVFPLVNGFEISNADKLRTYVEHVVMQIGYAIQKLGNDAAGPSNKLLVTGGGAFNTFLVQRLTKTLEAFNIDVVVPGAMLVNYKEALVMALIGVLRWREEYNVLDTVTGASRSSIGGAVWIGQEA
ncbi:anhydro-N-acetylmuramic acid kinase [Segetibacter aerophilus]|uniref:Anhydro-N-acetylmuramic acid kinase n=1 Tax=Segetibacter aerophilus TaxID=670293 RepID=A0A512B800_9BACT|nr:anhydro-N-acetylmuramic acid kinase [Segetibacter aerophilus]GEO08085.1 anhydro-N-acetylmuramic acid kinase [Segetibacter aerophilus]